MFPGGIEATANRGGAPPAFQNLVRHFVRRDATDVHCGCDETIRIASQSDSCLWHTIPSGEEREKAAGVPGDRRVRSENGPAGATLWAKDWREIWRAVPAERINGRGRYRRAASALDLNRSCARNSQQGNPVLAGLQGPQGNSSGQWPDIGSNESADQTYLE